MGVEENDNAAAAEPAASEAEGAFRAALLRSIAAGGARGPIGHVGEVEAAAAQFCREQRRQGHPPERMLRDAKRVIHEAIDGEHVAVAERAVQSCITHYYRKD